MIDLKLLRENPDRYRVGAEHKGIAVDIDVVLELDAKRRAMLSDEEKLRAEQKRLGKETGVEIGRLNGMLKKASDADRPGIEAQLRELKDRPVQLKQRIAKLDESGRAIEVELRNLLLEIPLPPDADVPLGASEEDNVQVGDWHPDRFDPAKSFEENRGFEARSHIELGAALGLFEFERSVKIAGTRSYTLTGDGMRLHQAVLRFGFDYMVNEIGFTAMSVPVIVREACMEGTGFFPGGRDQAYHVPETQRGAGHDLFLTGTGEVGLMAYHQGEILDAARLPLRYTTVSTCFRREAGAAGKDTAGLYRIHQFDKVEQVVICEADDQVSQQWHKQMIGYVETLLRRLELPYRIMQCCTGDLGPKNASMIDLECWMPSRGETGPDGRPAGAYGETHSASRLADFQCRRLALRYRVEGGKPVVCHSLNNTVVASPRILIPIIEMYQNEDGSITIPTALRPYMNGDERIG
ncbi:MAG: serine--tRNA ligase [Phycisphaerales bacterium]|nr:serine--tRNA ligase [Phycisphaerales bacterium]